MMSQRVGVVFCCGIFVSRADAMQKVSGDSLPASPMFTGIGTHLNTAAIPTTRTPTTDMTIRR